MEDRQFEQLIHKINPQYKLLRVWELKGGISAQVTAIEIEQPDGQTRKMVVRQHGEVDLKHNPHVAADEFNFLQLLQSAGIAAPKPVYLDESGEIFATPCIVIEFVEGKPEFAPSDLNDLLLQMAKHLSRIHTIDCSRLDVAFLPRQEDKYAAKFKQRPTIIDESLNEGRIRDVLESVWPLPQHNKPALLHGDFWPGNTLWRDGQLIAVIDWEDAEVGDPLADLANSRMEMVWAFGIDAMQRFTQFYQSMTPIDHTNLPYWDLCAALRPAGKISEWAADESVEKSMREGHRLFINQAFEKLSLLA